MECTGKNGEECVEMVTKRGKYEGRKIGYRATVEGNRGRGRPQRRWRDEVKELQLGRELSEREGMVLARDRDAWGRMVYRS